MDTSIIICNWNNKDYIGRAIRSCLKQSIAKDRYEIIVVDDFSTDGSQEVIKSFGDSVVSIFLEENVGIAEASNIGIRAALGRFVIRVDSDDYINEHTLLFMTEILNANHDIGFIHSDHLRVDEKENIIERVNLDTPEKVKRHGAGIMFRKSYLETLGLYDKEFKNAEDHDLLTRYYKNWDGYRIPLPLYRYRISEKQMTTNKKEREMWEIKSKNKNENI